MAEGLVSIVLEQLASVAFKQIEEEVSLVTGVDKEVENLILHFASIQGVLQDAEERQVTEANVRVWLDNLEDLSYQINDVLDEWNTEILKHQQMIEDSKGEIDDSSVHTKWTNKVRFFIPSARICFGKVGQLVMRHDIAKRFKQINERLTLVSALRQSYSLKSRKRGSEQIERSKTSSFVDVSSIIGRDAEKKNIINMLLSESSSSSSSNQQEGGRYVFSIVGMGGLGKTAFAQSIYDDDEVKTHFDQRIWVCVSDPFDQIKIAKDIVEVVDKDGEKLKSNNLQPFLERITQFTHGKKFLLVLDDVWNPTIDKWEPLKKALHQNSSTGSRIMVTTRNEAAGFTVGTTRDDHMIKLNKLNDKDCLELFKKIAFFDKNENDTTRFFDEGLMKKILDKGDGLPLAVKTLASIMRYKKTKEQWVDVLHSKMWELEQVEQQVFQTLLLSYYDLSSQVRRCLLYCAVFPKDSIIKKQELIELWKYQGYLGMKGIDKGKEAIVGERCFDNLVMRSFFQDFEKDEYGNIWGCKMHDVVHDFVQFVGKNECCVMEDSENNSVLDNKVRHLNCVFFSNFPLIYNCKRLRTLLASGGDAEELSAELILQMKSLRTLDLGLNDLKKLPREMGMLVHLRYLNLYFNDLEELPDSMGNLFNLEKLVLTRCGSLKKLPATMRKLINLKHLFIDKCEALKILPKWIGRLRSLQRLGEEESRLDLYGGADANKGFKLGDLRNLDQLQGTLWIVNLGSVKDRSEATNARLANKKDLTDLVLQFHPLQDDHEYQQRIKDDEEILNALQPYTNIEALDIRNYHGTSIGTRWLLSLNNLKTLGFTTLPYCASLAPLGKLASLEKLEIFNMRFLKRVGVEFLGIESETQTTSVISFPKLKTLEIQYMEELEEWEGAGGGEVQEGEIRESDVSRVGATIKIMPCLSELELMNCPKLKTVPDFLWKTPLQELVVRDCPNILQGCHTASGAEWDKVSHIPNIIIDRKVIKKDGLLLNLD